KPVYREYPPITLFTRYADAETVLRDYRTFASIGQALSKAQADAVPPEERTHIQLNPPVHTDVRRVLLAAVAPPVIRRALPRLESFGREIVDVFASRGHADLVADWAARYPAAAIASVLGLPDSDADMIHRLVDTSLDAGIREAEKRVGSVHARGANSINEWAKPYLTEQIRLRRTGEIDVDDGITRMIAFRTPSGRAFTDTELILHIRSLLIAGNETSTSMMSNLIYRVLLAPGLFEEVRADRSMIPSLIEESLRFEPPIQSVNRACSKEAVVGGEVLHPDEVACLSISSANRDEAIWGADAETFRPDRFAEVPDHDHLAFGLGIHYCLGAFLARTSATIALNALLDVTRDMRLAPDFEYEKIYYFLLRRPVRLPVEFEPVVA
ncbi:MAG: cytochrome P450, partial [Microbacterium sp.]